MNDDEFDPRLEAEVRAELKRTITPPAAPIYVRERVERMAEDQIEADGRRHGFGPWPGHGAILGRLAVAAVVVVLVAATVVTLTGSGNMASGPGAASSKPSPVPTDIAARSGDPAATPGPTYQPDPRDVQLLDATADGSAVVLVGGNAIRVSTDGGDTWSAARPLPAGASALNASYVDAQHGWSLARAEGSTADGLIMFRTSDGGLTWKSSPVGSMVVRPGSWTADWEFHFADANHGYVRTYGVNDPAIEPTPYSNCLQSTTDDGGVTWSAPGSVSCSENHPTWVTNELGYASGLTPMDSISVTQDGGRTWVTAGLAIAWDEIGWSIELLVAEPGQLHVEIGFTPKNGSDWPPRHAVYDSTEGRDPWFKAYDLNPAQDIQVMAATSFDHWFARTNAHGGDTSSLIASDDGGRTWYEVASSFVPSMGPMRWFDGRRGIVQGFTCPNGGTSATCSNHSTVYVTNDGGRTWHQVPF